MRARVYKRATSYDELAPVALLIITYLPARNALEIFFHISVETHRGDVYLYGSEISSRPLNTGRFLQSPLSSDCKQRLINNGIDT